MSGKEEKKQDQECECKNCECNSEECECKDGECKCGYCECPESSSSSEIEKLQMDLAQEKGERLALLAEFVNYKKRNDADRGEFIVYANKSLLLQIIDIVDDFDRSLKGVENDEKGLFEGVKLIYKKLLNLITSNGLQLIDIKEGDEFSPGNMEAITTVKVEDAKEHNKVIEVMQKGYLNKRTGKVFKNAIVAIGKKD
jgi:molecular chaperone GrpE